MNTDGGYPAEAELLSSHDSHQVIADRLGISANVVRFYCDRLVQSFRLSRCTHGDGTSEQQPSWDPYGQQQDPRQYQGQQYPVQQQPYGYQPLYGQQPRQSSFTPDPQYGTPPGQPSYQHQARYSGTPREQLYSQAPPQQYDSELHRYLRDQYGQWQANPGAWPQPDRRRWSRSLVYAGIAALIVIAGGGAAYALAGHGTGSASAAKPLTCKQQYDAWKTGPARAQGKQIVADLSKITAAASAEDITALTSALKTAGDDATTLEQYPMPACADPGGYWVQMLARIKASGDNAASASGLSALILAEVPLKEVPGLEAKLTAELKRHDLTPAKAPGSSTAPRPSRSAT
jgi:hypothetical protein